MNTSVRPSLVVSRWKLEDIFFQFFSIKLYWSISILNIQLLESFRFLTFIFIAPHHGKYFLNNNRTAEGYQKGESDSGISKRWLEAYFAYLLSGFAHILLFLTQKSSFNTVTPFGSNVVWSHLNIKFGFRNIWIQVNVCDIRTCTSHATRHLKMQRDRFQSIPPQLGLCTKCGGEARLKIKFILFSSVLSKIRGKC